MITWYEHCYWTLKKKLMGSTASTAVPHHITHHMHGKYIRTHGFKYFVRHHWAVHPKWVCTIVGLGGLAGSQGAALAVKVLRWPLGGGGSAFENCCLGGFQQTIIPHAQVIPTPEPSSFAILTVSIILTAIVLRRRNKQDEG